MKTQMQLANRAWRNVTKSYGWDKGWKGGKRKWKAFCRENAYQTVLSESDIYSGEMMENYADAECRVLEELSYWD